MKLNVEKCLFILGIIVLINLLIVRVNYNKIFVKEIYVDEYVNNDVKANESFVNGENGTDEKNEEVTSVIEEKTESEIKSNEENKNKTTKEEINNESNKINKTNENSIKEEKKINEDNKESSSSLEQINNRLRNELLKKYNVFVGYKDELDGNYLNENVTPIKLYNDEEINAHLNKINTALSKYPSSFFKEIKDKWKPLSIYLVKGLNVNIAGLTDNKNANSVIILINTGGYLFESTLHHEIMHYIDCYLTNLVGVSVIENSMMEYNPSGFIYGKQTNEYVYYYDNPAYFLSAYAKTNYKEDRAVLFENMMFRTVKKDYYVKGNPINEKSRVISEQLSTYFDCVKDNVQEHWERFVAW